MKELDKSLTKLADAFCSKIHDGKEINGLIVKINATLDEFEKMNHIIDALQLDAQSILPLMEQIQQKREEARLSFQKAVDIDFKVYGKISNLTNQALEAYHFAITPEKKVVAVADAVTDYKMENLPEQKQTEEKTPDPKDYLHLPRQDKPQFKKTLKFLKENGAKFDVKAKAWYLTPESNTANTKDDLNKKQSVLSKLGKNRDEIEKNRDTVSKENTAEKNQMER